MEKISEKAAWWGAIVSTLIFIWDVYKWKTSGAKLTFKVSPNMLVFGDPRRESEKYISATVSNIGDRATTIKGLYLEHYVSFYKKIRKKPDTSMIITNPNLDFPLPRLLNLGEEWNGLAPQTKEIENLANSGYLYCMLSQSHTKKYLRKRVVIKKQKESQKENEKT